MAELDKKSGETSTTSPTTATAKGGKGNEKKIVTNQTAKSTKTRMIKIAPASDKK